MRQEAGKVLAKVLLPGQFKGDEGRGRNGRKERERGEEGVGKSGCNGKGGKMKRAAT